MPESRERLTARKIRAADVLNGTYHKQEGFEPNYLVTTYGLTVSRARLIGTVVDTYVNDDESYGALVLDDGTGTLRAKFFQDVEPMLEIEEGDIVEVIGKVKRYDGELYMTPELIVQRDATYELLRAVEAEAVQEQWDEYLSRAAELQEDGRSEDDIVQELQGEGLKENEIQGLLRRASNPDPSPAQPVPEEGETAEDEDGDARTLVLNAIDAVDEGDGAEYADITDRTGLDDEALEAVINDLLSDGTCYEPRPGRIKRL